MILAFSFSLISDVSSFWRPLISWVLGWCPVARAEGKEEEEEEGEEEEEEGTGEGEKHQ